MNLQEAYDGMLDAVKSERISMERLDESVNKIPEYKQQFVYGK